MQLELVRTYTGFKELANEWNELSLASGASFFLTHEWLDLWWKTYGGDKELFIVSGREGGNILALAPMMLRLNRFGPLVSRSIEFIGSGQETTPDHLSLICAPGYKKEFIAALCSFFMSQRAGWDEIRLRDMEEDNEVFSGFREALPGYKSETKFSSICPYIRLRPSWDDFQKGLSKKVRYNIGKKERFALRDNAVSFQICENRENLERLLPVLEVLHRKRMEEKETEGVSLQPLFWKFHGESMKYFLERGKLFLGTVSFNGTETAFQYCFKHAGTILMYQSGLDPSYNRFSAGFLLNSYMIKEAIRQGYSEFDFLRGGERYKFHWTSEFRKNCEFSVYNRNVRGWAAWKVQKGKQGLKKILIEKGFLKQQQALEQHQVAEADV